MKISKNELKKIIKSILNEDNPVKGPGSAFDTMDKFSKDLKNKKLNSATVGMSNVPMLAASHLASLHKIKIEVQLANTSAASKSQLDAAMKKYDDTVKKIIDLAPKAKNCLDDFNEDVANAYLFYNNYPEEKIEDNTGYTGAEALELINSISDKCQEEGIK